MLGFFVVIINNDALINYLLIFVCILKLYYSWAELRYRKVQ